MTENPISSNSSPFKYNRRTFIKLLCGVAGVVATAAGLAGILYRKIRGFADRKVEVLYWPDPPQEWGFPSVTDDEWVPVHFPMMRLETLLGSRSNNGWQVPLGCGEIPLALDKRVLMDDPQGPVIKWSPDWGGCGTFDGDSRQSCA